MGVMTLPGAFRFSAVLTGRAVACAEASKRTTGNVPAIPDVDQASRLQMLLAIRITYGELHLRLRGRVGGVKVQI